MADYVTNLHQRACRTCSTILFPHPTDQIIDLWCWRCRWRCRRRFLGDLTQRDGWKTQDGRMTKKRLCIPIVTRHFFRHSAVLNLLAVLLRKVSLTTKGAQNNLGSVLIWPYLGIRTARAVVKWRSRPVAKGGFPLSRNFYVRTDVNFNWLYVRKLK